MTDSEKLDLILNEMSSLSNEVSSLSNEVYSLSNKMASIELTIENETNHNIKVIAEGHADLTRKLDDALKVENEKELLLIRVNILENEVRLIKERLIHIA